MTVVDSCEVGFDLARAQAEASRCLLCLDPPCSKGCPAGTDPGAFVRKLRLRNVTGAIRTIRVNNVLGGTCGLLCPTSRLCEKGCSASGIDRPVRIGRIQHALVEHGWAFGFSPLVPGAPRAERVAVLGSGPAGLTCAAELARGGCAVTVFERRAEAGGQLRYGVPEHRYPTALLERELADIRALGVDIRCSSPVEDAEALLGQGYDAVFLGPGLGDSVRATGAPGPVGVVTAAEFLAGTHGSPAPSWGAMVPLSDLRVAVIGGGSVAIDSVETALRAGAREVWLIYRRGWLQMPALAEEKQAIMEAGAQLLLLHQPVGYVADDAGVLRQIRLVRTRLTGANGSGRPSCEPLPDSEWLLDVDLVVEAVGQLASADSPSWYPGVHLRDDRRIRIDEYTGATNVPGLFAGGDITRGPGLIVEAVADGKRAAAAILAHLDKREVERRG